MATILTKRSNTAASVPLAAQLTNSSLGAELAVNTTDKRLYTKDGSGNVVEIGTNPSALSLPNGTANGVVYLNGSKAATSGSALVFDGSNLGLGVTPSAWNSGYKVAEIGKSGSSVFAGTSSGNVIVASNAYLNASDAWTYANNGGAAYFGVRNSDRSFVWNISSTGSGTAGNAITFTQAMTLDASGNLLVGTTTAPQVNGKGIAIYDTNFPRITMRNSTSGDGTGDGFQLVVNGADVDIANQENGALKFFTNGANERARIDTSGNLLVGTTNTSLTAGAGVKIYPGSDGTMAIVGATSTNGNNAYHLYSTGAGAYRFYVGYGGTISATSTTITGISDVRLKENIRDLDEGLATVLALKPRKFDWKAGKGKDIKGDRGWIAQEFEQVLPDMIEQWLDAPPEGEEPYKAVNANITPILVKAIQEQQALIDSLTQRIAALEAAA